MNFSTGMSRSWVINRIWSDIKKLEQDSGNSSSVQGVDVTRAVSYGAGAILLNFLKPQIQFTAQRNGFYYPILVLHVESD